jgi:hypothetical protein
MRKSNTFVKVKNNSRNFGSIAAVTEPIKIQKRFGETLTKEFTMKSIIEHDEIDQ